MKLDLRLISLVVSAAALALTPMDRVSACCPAPAFGKPVVNADQTVIILWDPATKTEHFIRKASFRSEADDFGFLVPSPNRPELAESGNEAFPYLAQITAPEVIRSPRSGGMGCGCSKEMPSGEAFKPAVTVLEEKEVAGFHAAVLEANSAAALVDWLKDHGYAFSPAVEAWAEPYIKGGWKITAMKVSKGDQDPAKKAVVAASALRMSFKTDRPLFPYREPDYADVPHSLTARARLLRIYFVADARYEGGLTKDQPWTGRVAWAGRVSPDARARALELLNLPADAGPATWWLTEFEDRWPYQLAPADVYFSRAADQKDVRRPRVSQSASATGSTDATVYALAALVAFRPLRKLYGKNRASRN